MLLKEASSSVATWTGRGRCAGGGLWPYTALVRVGGGGSAWAPVLAGSDGASVSSLPLTLEQCQVRTPAPEQMKTHV